jgi:hypothetical protein
MSMPGATFYRIAALASLLSAATTLVLIFARDFYPTPADLSARMALVEHPVYLFRAWVYLVHPFLTFTAALGLATAWHRRQPGLTTVGIAGFALWAATEAAQQCLTLFAFDRWRRLWLAGDAAVRETMALRAAIYDGLWDAAYVLIVIGFFIGNLCLAIAFAKGRGLDRVVAIFLLLAALLTATIIIVEFGGPALLTGAISDWAYPAIQPAGRTLIGLWLWRFARKTLSGERDNRDNAGLARS